MTNEKCSNCNTTLVILGLKKFCSNCQFIDIESDGMSFNNW